MKISTVARSRFIAPMIALIMGTIIAVAIAVGTGAFASASTPVVGGLPLAAPAVQPVYLTDIDTVFKGWAEVGRERCVDDPGVIGRCTAYITSQPAYKWTGSSWSSRRVDIRTKVYVWPFAANWSWVWTANTGWLAMQDKYIIVEWRPYAVAT